MSSSVRPISSLSSVVVSTSVRVRFDVKRQYFIERLFLNVGIEQCLLPRHSGLAGRGELVSTNQRTKNRYDQIQLIDTF